MAGRMKTDIHSLLARQLQRHLTETTAIPERWLPFLNAVNAAYVQSDNDRNMIERSLDLSSQELLLANSEMRSLIGKLKKSEKEKEHLIRKLEAKNKETEQFTYAVAHDLKAPVVTILGFLEYLRRDAREGNTERLEADFRQIHAAATQMARILEELLELTRVGKVSHDLKEVSLFEVAKEAASLVAGRIVEKDVTVTIAPDLPTVMGDRPRLLQVFQNLIENAVKFMGSQAEPRVDIFLRHDESRPVCCVRDNGQGIDPRHHEKVFGLFDRLSKEAEGTGIGLALVKRIVETHGGQVWVESEGEKRGSTFCLTLPWGD